MQDTGQARRLWRYFFVVSRRCLRRGKRRVRRKAWAVVFALLRPQWLHKFLLLFKSRPALAQLLLDARNYAQKRSKPFVFIKKLNVSAEQIASFRQSRAPTPPPMRRRQLGEDPERGRGQIKAKNPELHAQVMQGLSAEREAFRSVPAPPRKSRKKTGTATRSGDKPRKKIRSFDEARKNKNR